jgi:hypothetical protein
MGCENAEKLAVLKCVDTSPRFVLQLDDGRAKPDCQFFKELAVIKI